MDLNILLIEYLETYMLEVPYKDEQERTNSIWWNNAINEIQTNLAVNGDFTLWLENKGIKKQYDKGYQDGKEKAKEIITKIILARARRKAECGYHLEAFDLEGLVKEIEKEF